VIDEDAKIVTTAENLGWTDLPLGDMVAARFALPVAFGQDVRAGALAEWRLGAGRGQRDMAFIAVGTGVATAVIVDGMLVRAGGYAGEIGHGGSLTGERCVCGGRGCLETYASGAAIARQYTQVTGVAVDGARGVLTAAEAGDGAAQAVWGRAVDGLAQCISDTVRLLGTPRVVVGGGVIAAGEALMGPLSAAVRARLTVHRVPELVPAALGGDAGLYGAGLYGADLTLTSHAEW
jgi:glucokinase